jgi:hypothetical protein
VGACSCRNLAKKIAGNDGIGISAAYAFRRFWRNSAGTHVADLAANAAFAEAALGFLSFRTIKAGFYAVGAAFFEHLRRSVVAYF